MNYGKIIIDLLFAAGEDGLAVKDISRYVFNANNSFFEPLDYDLVRKQVSSYLIRNSKKTDSVIRKGTHRGTYCLNLNSEVFRQLQFQFDELQQEETSPASEEDPSLSLF